MLHSVHDINPARLNAIIPALQRMEEDPAFLERERHRFDDDDPPPPYSSGSITRFPTPDPFAPVANDVNIDELLRKPLTREEIHRLRKEVDYRPHYRYDGEFDLERDRIYRDYGRNARTVHEFTGRAIRDWGPLDRIPNLYGRVGEQQIHIMIRHSIKKRWERLGVWDPEWGIPKRVHYRPQDYSQDWVWTWDRDKSYRSRKYDSLLGEVQMASWPSLDEETPRERAVRQYLKEKGEWDESLDPPPPETGSSTEFHVDDREKLVTSRPWFLWNLEVAEEEVRMRRHPDAWDWPGENVTRRWKEKGHWKDSWGRGEPGWRWRHESPSPEPADPDTMEFTPSEIDALEEIPPPTPLPEPEPLERRAPTWSNIFGWLPGYDPDSQSLIFPEPIPRPQADSDGDHEDNRPETTVEHTSEELRQGLVKNNGTTVLRGDHEELVSPARSSPQNGVCSTRRNRHRPQHQSTTQRVTRSAPHTNGSTQAAEIPSSVTWPRRGRPTSRATTEPSKIRKRTLSPRRSARIAAREQQLKNATASSQAAETRNKEAQGPQQVKELKQQQTKALTKATRRRRNPVNKGNSPASSKPQGVTKRKSRSRSRRLNV
jgi:hypothetical protein